MMYGIQFRKGFILITGEIGCGKTTLCKSLIEKLPGNIKSALILNPGLSSVQLMRAAVDDFGIKNVKNNKIDLLKTLNSFLIDELRGNNNVVLIIDESQNLSLSALEQIRMLSNLETEKEKLIQIILVGQPELIQKLSSPKLVQLKQRIAVKYHINALSQDEISLYIHHRLQQASTLSSLSFTQSAIDDIYRFTKGVPRLINLLCDKVLLLGYVRSEHKITSEMIQVAQNELEVIMS